MNIVAAIMVPSLVKSLEVSCDLPNSRKFMKDSNIDGGKELDSAKRAEVMKSDTSLYVPFVLI